MTLIEGIGVSSGVSISTALVVSRKEPPECRKSIVPENIEHERKRLLDALSLTRDQLEKTKLSIAKNMGTEKAGLIDAQIMLLSDPMIVDPSLERISSELVSAETALSDTIEISISSFKSFTDSFFQERLQEFLDIKNRVIANLLGNDNKLIPEVKESRILVIDHLSPSETAQLFGSNYVGIVCEMGGETSHIAIMARTMEIPAVLGVENATKLVTPNSRVIVDGNEGRVYVNPDSPTIEKNLNKIERISEMRELVLKENDLDPVTTDGREIIVASNIELPEEVRIMKTYRSKGIGLFRTELLYMTSPDFPSEELQTRIYQRVIQECKNDLVIIRTFDIGGDKLSDKLDQHLEPNPFLGWRAIRIGLDFPHLLKTQIRAILRASIFGKCAIMFPMISNLNEVIRAKEITEQAKLELTNEGLSFDPDVQVGIMIEVPSAALMSYKIAPHIDFMSIGTNDLIQYTLAVDRGNERVSKLYKTYSPAVLELIKRTIDAGHSAGKWVGMCGEMAGKPLAIPLLVGLGIDELSVNPSQIPLVRSIIRRISSVEAKKIADQVMDMQTHEEVIGFLKQKAEENLPEQIVQFI
jgi:phosphotransferase system enzyme I (PtsI)